MQQCFKRKFCNHACKTAHGNVKSPCAYCGKLVAKKRHKTQGGKTMYCSRQCACYDLRDKRRSEIVTRECLWCKAKFQAAQHTRKTFCTHACSAMESAVRRSIPKITRTCEQCGGEFQIDQWRDARRQAGKRDGSFCSRRCLGVFGTKSNRNISKAETAFLDGLELAVGIKIDRQAVVFGFSCDGYIPSLSAAIEFDGAYWHSLPRAIERDKKKTLGLANAGVLLIRVDELAFKRNQKATIERCAAVINSTRLFQSIPHAPTQSHPTP